MRQHSHGRNSVGIAVLLWISAASAISTLLRLEKPAECYPPPKNLLWRYVRKDNLTALESLLTRHPNELNGRFPCLRNQTLLHQAAGHGAHQAVTWLLERGAPLEPRDQENRTPLMEAARGGHSKTVRILLQRGSDPKAVDGQGRNALHLGAGHPRVVEKILRRNQDGGIPASAAGLLGASDSSGDTALHRAAAAGSKESLDLLLQAGARVNSTNQAGETALHQAVLNRRLNATRTLLESGADPNSALKDGLRPIHLAIPGNGEEVVRMLLERGADVNAKGGAGEKTPLSLAMESGKGGLVALLKAKGGTQ